MRCVVLSWLLLALWTRGVLAEGVVLEAYVGQRPGDAAPLFGPIHDELEQRGYTGRDALARLYERRVSRAARASDAIAADFVASVDRGHKAWIGGKFDEAISTLTPLVAEAQAHPIPITQNQTLRDAMLKALIALAISHQRTGDLAEAKVVLKEMIRTYPNTPVLRSIYGPEAFALYEDVRRAAGRGGRGTMTVKVGDNAAVFVNERFDHLGTASQTDLIPGIYRVFAQVAKQISRVHYIEVRADEETVVTIDAPFDTALHTSAEWIGLSFPSPAERERREAVFAARFAKDLGRSSAIVIGIDSVKGRPSVTGALIDVGSARELRRASLALSPAPSDDRLRQLAIFLAGGEAAAGLDVEVGAPVGTDKPAGRTAGGRWLLWAGIGGVVLGTAVGGGLALKFGGDASDAGDELDRICAVTCTPDQVRTFEAKQTTANRNAIISLAAGGTVVVAGIVFIVLSRFSGDAASSVAISPLEDGAIGTYAITF